MRSWNDALTFTGNLNACENTDWRLPNILELESIINLGQAGSALWLTQPENGFVGIAANKYWSSTTASFAPVNAWAIDFFDNGRDIVSKSSLLLTLPVRGTTTSPAQLWETGQAECYNTSGNIVLCAETGQDGEIKAGAPWPSSRFLDFGNGTIRDNLTGLIWTANANTPGPTACGSGVAKISYDSYLFVQCLNNNIYLGYNDWRVPNRKELQSLIDHSQSNPALPEGNPFTGSGTYWSSNTYVNQCNLGWAIDMNTGLVTESYKNPTNALHVWPVRGPLSLKVLLAGDGVGIVTGDGVSCNGNKCLGVFYGGEVITVTAESSTDSVFGGWAGCPSGESGSECNILMSGDITLTATFLAAKSIWEKPASLNFGKVGLGVVSPQKYVSVKNHNTTDLHIETISITGTNVSEFILDEDCTAIPLSSGGTCSIALRVNAQGYGTRRAELVVTSNDTKMPAAKMKLKAKAMPAKIYVKPKTLSFGKVSTAGSASREMTIENSGTTPLTIMTITKAGENPEVFTFVPSSCPVLQEGETCILTVTFAPGGIGGKRTATLVISSDAPKKGTVNFKLKGEGI
jgi:hypothetical protein